MFERFTERARQVIVLAQEEARELGHGFIGTEHLLLGLLREEEGVAARVLDGLHITTDRVRAELVPARRAAGDAPLRQTPLAAATKEVLEVALREALSLGDKYIDTEHILLAVVRGDECRGARILLDFDAGPHTIRNEVTHRLSSRSETASGVPRWAWQEDVAAVLDRILARLEEAPALIPRRRARRLVEDALRRQDAGAEARLGKQAWEAMVEEVLDANPDVEAA